MSGDPDDDGPESEPSGPRPMTAVAATGWALGATFLVILFLSLAHSLRPAAQQLDMVSEVGAQAVGYLITLFLILRVHAPDAGVRDFVGMRPTNPLFYPLAIALGLALHAPADALFSVIERRWPMEDHITETFQAASGPMRAAMALSIILVGPMLEEMLFRGALFRPMLKVHPPWMVIAVTATLFALAHLAPQTWLPILLLGLVLGFVRRVSGSLVPSMLVHATFNAVPFYRMAAHRPGAPEPGPLPPWVIVASAAAALVLLGGVRALGTRGATRTAQEFDQR
jgi:membrane protease YdiL (CAAX protease family)